MISYDVKLFKKLDYEKVELNFVVYNILIAAYCRIGNVMEAFKLRDATKSGGILPTCATYSSLILGMCCIGCVMKQRNFLKK